MKIIFEIMNSLVFLNQPRSTIYLSFEYIIVTNKGGNLACALYPAGGFNNDNGGFVPK